MTLAVVTFAFIVIIAVAGAVAMVWRARRLVRKADTSRLPFRWQYIVLPLAILLAAIVLSGYFYGLLPETVAYHFQADGTPDRWSGRGLALVWVLAPQLVLTMVAAGIVRGMCRLNVLAQPGDSVIRPESILLFMGNMVGLPQLILAFAMLDIFSYNAYQMHFLPLWLVVLIALGLSTVALGIFFARMLSRARRQTTS
ncbi:MAG: DUF1648 domain-containing protein [Chloroflexi bacterium]|nr:DUF1648 domain-containing protein [Chloroflexota bacterium]